MIDDDFFYDVIKDKVIDYVEVVVLLFEHCNMSCVFCPQDHNDLLGATREEILSKCPQIIKFINENPKKDFLMHIMGGELFQDKFINSGFINYYQEFIDTIKSNVKEDKNITFLFVTNLVYDCIDEVVEFCKKNKLKMNVSYDLAGRFTQPQLEIYKKNIEKFKEYVNIISLVITKQNIDKLLKGDEYFDYLYENFICDWDKLLPGKNFNDALMPKQSELFMFYKHLVDKYPRCNNVKYFTDKEQRHKMSCTRGSSYTILNDNSVPKGCSGSVLLKDPKTQELGGTKIIQFFMKEHDCFSCEFYSRCGFTCFIRNDYKNLIKDMDECVFKEVFKYVESKNNISKENSN
jgi:hypothetical protein